MAHRLIPVERLRPASIRAAGPRRRAAAGGALALLALLPIAGCAPAGTAPAPPVTASSGSGATPTSAASSPAAGGLIGGPTHAYPLPDGSTVTVHEGRPLPQAVLDDLERQVAAFPAAGEFEQGHSSSAAIEAAAQLAIRAKATTGHQVLTVVSVWTSEDSSEDSPPDPDDLYVGYWLYDDGTPRAGLEAANYDDHDRAAVVAYGRQWIAAQPDAASWVLLD